MNQESSSVSNVLLTLILVAVLAAATVWFYREMNPAAAPAAAPAERPSVTIDLVAPASSSDRY
jgi:hypothetical protein